MRTLTTGGMIGAQRVTTVTSFLSCTWRRRCNDSLAVGTTAGAAAASASDSAAAAALGRRGASGFLGLLASSGAVSVANRNEVPSRRCLRSRPLGDTRIDLGASARGGVNNNCGIKREKKQKAQAYMHTNISGRRQLQQRGGQLLGVAPCRGCLLTCGCGCGRAELGRRSTDRHFWGSAALGGRCGRR